MVDKPQGISKITVSGFKSLYDETSIDIRPLTILAGANSSGKSSIMQPLLLMKQTLESEYTPKVFRLDGANVKYTRADQFFHIDEPDSEFAVTIEADNLGVLSASYTYIDKNLKITETSFIASNDNTFKSKSGKIVKDIKILEGMQTEDLENQLPDEWHELRNAVQNASIKGNIIAVPYPYLCFLTIGMFYSDGTLAMTGNLPFNFIPLHKFSYHIQDIIHVPGLRDNPQRNYPVASIEGNFKGTFDKYFASVIASDLDCMGQTADYLRDLGLIAKGNLSVIRGTTKLRLKVPHALNTPHFINIADVGLGVSQVLPVLVALLVAKPGQLVYLEQPELHLHPRAQVALAQILADAANRGVRVVVETHSSLLLIGIQTLIAEGKLKPDDTILHWFTRGEDGRTTVDSQTPDENGAYGDWPEDFADVELDAQGAYLDAVARRQLSTEAGD